MKSCSVSKTGSIVDENGVAIANMTKSPNVYPDAMAKARLLAAAPDLLAALDKILGQISVHGSVHKDQECIALAMLAFERATK